MLFENHPPTAYEGTGKREDTRHEARDTPNGLCRPCESPKVQLRQPIQGLIRKVVGRVDQKQRVKPPWEGKIDTRHRPNQNERETPESQRTMQAPVDAGEVHCPAYL